jgi:hypothetical protein
VLRPGMIRKPYTTVHQLVETKDTQQLNAMWKSRCEMEKDNNGK